MRIRGVWLSLGLPVSFVHEWLAVKRRYSLMLGGPLRASQCRSSRARCSPGHRPWWVSRYNTFRLCEAYLSPRLKTRLRSIALRSCSLPWRSLWARLALGVYGVCVWVWLATPVGATPHPATPHYAGGAAACVEQWYHASSRSSMLPPACSNLCLPYPIARLHDQRLRGGIVIL